MATRIIFLSVLLCLLPFSGKLQILNKNYQYKYKRASIDDLCTYAVKLNPNLTKKPKNLHIKSSINGWKIVFASKRQLLKLKAEGIVTQIHHESGLARPMNDSIRSTHFINLIHSGTGGLPSSYTGKGVVLGYVDTGMDFNHGDFIDSNGNTRVIRYWDQQAVFDPIRTPVKYGYGQVFDSSDINFGPQPDYSGSGHGSTVSGTGSGNGLANGLNKGVAPQTSIIMVRTNFNLPNWTLTVAESIDYIFAVADSLGLPAVVNVSAGDYLGSHDGNDPAALYIDSLLNQHPGRIVVCAAGNSGQIGKYHVHGEVDADTSFVWMIPNASSSFGSPAVFADVWADTSEIKNVKFAFGADAAGPIFRGRTQFYSAMDNLGVADVYDSIYVNGNRIGKVDFSESIEGSNYHLQFVVYTDSSSYNFRFITTGAGSYDAWSGAAFGLSDFESNVPSVATFPEIANYHMPDTLMTTVSSFACSEKVITVANMENRDSYIDTNGNLYVPTPFIPRGKLSPTSSKGPNRIGEQKPDVTAAGNLTLSAFNLNEIAYVYANNPSMLGAGGLHVRNGGTSMASPIVAGIAALYLEKCPNSTWQDFKTDLLNTTFSNSFMTHPLPNYAYGYGAAHGLNTLLSTNYNSVIVGDTIICDSATIGVYPNPSSIVWSNSSTDYPLEVDSSGYYSAEMTNNEGCKSKTDTIYLTFGNMPTSSTISYVNDTLFASPNTSYQWFFNGNLISGATNQTYVPEHSGNYTVSVTDTTGVCSAISNSIEVGISGLKELQNNTVQIYPNPTYSAISIKGVEKGTLTIYDINGKKVKSFTIVPNSKYALENLPKGTYLLEINSKKGKIQSKVIKF